MITDSLLLFGVAFAGTVFWPANPDAAVVAFVAGRGHPPALAVLLATAGQMVMLSTLHLTGHLLRARWAWLDRQCLAVHARWGKRLARSTLLMVAICGLTGVPPSAPTILLAATLEEVPASRYLPLFAVCRAIWFVGVALLARRLFA